MGRLSADFSPAFLRDVKRLAKRKHKDLSELEEVIGLVLENTAESERVLRQRHGMHALTGKWSGHSECHVANAGDWLLIWVASDEVAFFERTGTHDELFR